MNRANFSEFGKLFQKKKNCQRIQSKYHFLSFKTYYLHIELSFLEFWVTLLKKKKKKKN